MMAEHVPERRRSEIEGNSSLAHLERIEIKLDAMARVQDAVAREQEIQNLAIRSLQDWRLEMSAYFRQLKWAIALAGGAVVVGVVNIVLELAKH
jgi:hypothetical protein